MPKYRKKPVVIDAEPFEPENEQQHERLGIIKRADGTYWVNNENWMVSSTDWIITVVNGNRYPCKPDIFEATYDLVVDSP